MLLLKGWSISRRIQECAGSVIRSSEREIVCDGKGSLNV